MLVNDTMITIPRKGHRERRLPNGGSEYPEQLPISSKS